MLFIGALFFSYSAQAKEDALDMAKRTNWRIVAEESSSVLLDRFWNSRECYFNAENDEHSKDFAYWPQAHAIDVILDGYIRSENTKYKDIFDAWYSGIKAKNGGTFWNVFYDDMEWIALAMLRLYDNTKDEKYLKTTDELWGYIKKGWDEKYAEGGISWKSDQPWSKNACSNGPASILASRLYNISKRKEDKEWAIKIYKWEREHLFNKETGAVADNINGKRDSKWNFSFTYNQGTFLGAAHELFKITKDFQYLKDAMLAADFTLTSPQILDKTEKVLRDEGKGDGGLFKGIFTRYLVLLMLDENLPTEKREKYADFLYLNAQILMDKGVNIEELLFNSSWILPPQNSVTQLTSQTSACMLLEMTALYHREKTKLDKE